MLTRHTIKMFCANHCNFLQKMQKTHDDFTCRTILIGRCSLFIAQTDFSRVPHLFSLVNLLTYGNHVC